MVQTVSNVERLLTDYRDHACRALLASLPECEPQGYLYELMDRQLVRAGKGLGPAPCHIPCIRRVY